jgi:hypothetical protein
MYIPTDPTPISANLEPDAIILTAFDAAPKVVIGDLLQDTDNTVPDFAALKEQWHSEFRASLKQSA